jgi:single-strand DNA-binding protein
MGQHLILTGRLGRDPEMRYTGSGKAFTKFSLATSRRYTSNGSRVEETTWWDVTVWGGQAEACAEYLSKGDIVEVTGEITGERVEKESGKVTIYPRIWTGRDGKPRCSYEVRARHVEFHQTSGNGQRQSAPDEPAPIPF